MALTEQIDALEQRLTQLLGALDTIATAHQAALTREQQLLEECNRLRKKNELASLQIEGILDRLTQPQKKTG